MEWFIHVHRTNTDSFFKYGFGKVQYFRTELLFHNFHILEHPLYPGPYRSRFIALHDSESMISYIALRYGDHVQFDYIPLEL